MAEAMPFRKNQGCLYAGYGLVERSESIWESVPQGLKPLSSTNAYGTAKAVPFRKSGLKHLPCVYGMTQAMLSERCTGIHCRLWFGGA
jgi:hypothetical protein